MMNIPAALVAAFPPSQDALLDFARKRIDDSMLLEIARADYGCDAEAHLAALRPIRDEGSVVSPMQWQPGEVLELTSYCDPEQPEGPPFEPGPTGRRGHLIRLFA
jgi:hypothetical protein